MIPEYYIDPEINPEVRELRKTRELAAAEEDRCRRMAQCAAYLAATEKLGLPEKIDEAGITELVDLNNRDRKRPQA